MSASAGSGKTYNLVRTYMSLILGDHRDPVHFQSVLAMTFTNKAASEMKQRVIDALNTLGYAAENDKKEQLYLSETALFLGLEKSVLQQRARLVLKQILHQYENFNVLTIDKFNLRLIRTFSRDLNINNDFQTSTNEKDVLSELVDQLFSEINQEHASNLTELTLRYSREKIEENLQWDFKSELKSLAEVLTKEQNQSLIAQLMEIDFSMGYYEKIKTRIGEIKKQTSGAAMDLHSLFFSYDTSNFPGKTTTERAYAKLKEEELFQTENIRFFGSSVTKLLNDEGEKKGLPTDLIEKTLAFSALFEKNYEAYHELHEFRSNFFNIAMLQLIAKALNNYKKSDNIVLISEFNKLISELLSQEEAAYIYERIGNRYKYFLLDEFQDTSHLQWVNLIPLVHDSLANGQQNLIVGDPKQSIYRFKNGLAEQFVALPGIYNPQKDPSLALKSLYFEQAGELIALKENWRSKAEIVQFNNLFFSLCKDLEPDIMGDFYQDIHQEVKGGAGGYVFVESLLAEQEDAFSDNGNDLDGASESTGDLQFLSEWVNDCLAQGYDKGDICILGYQKSDCNKWANYLSDLGHKVVSADSLLMGSDPDVKLVVAYLKWRINPIGELEARQFSEMYFDRKGANALSQVRTYWKKITIGEREKMIFDSTQFINEIFGGEAQFFFHYENLYQLFEQFCVIAGLNELSNPYLHQFADYVYLFDLNVGPDINLLLENYANEGKNQSVQIPENREAIKIMTGHKSKGLEFPIVMIPSMNWNIMSREGRFLIRQHDYFYYTSLSKSSKLSGIREAYQAEFRQALLDKINLNYVLFTRAKDRLYVRNTRSKRNMDNLYQNRMHNWVSSLPGVQETEQKLVYEAGIPAKKENNESDIKKQDLILIPGSISEHLWFPEISLQDRALLESDALSEQQRFGNQLHALLAETDDLDQPQLVFEKLRLKGLVEHELEERLASALDKLISLPAYRVLFENAVSILREQTILLGEQENKRPDLIIIKEHETIVLDYKTGMKNDKHLKQVTQYVGILKQMNYPQVKGFVYYTGVAEMLEV